MEHTLYPTTLASSSINPNSSSLSSSPYGAAVASTWDMRETQLILREVGVFCRSNISYGTATPRAYANAIRYARTSSLKTRDAGSI